MSTNRPRPPYPSPGWSGLPHTEQERIKQETAADDARRRATTTSSTRGPNGDAVVSIHELPNGRFSTVINHTGTETKVHDSFQNAIEHARRSYMEKQRSQKRITMQSADRTQAARGNAAGSDDCL